MDGQGRGIPRRKEIRQFYDRHLVGLVLHFMIPHPCLDALSAELLCPPRQRKCSYAIAGTACWDRGSRRRQCCCAIAGLPRGRCAAAPEWESSEEEESEEDCKGTWDGGSFSRRDGSHWQPDLPVFRNHISSDCNFRIDSSCRPVDTLENIFAHCIVDQVPHARRYGMYLSKPPCWQQSTAKSLLCLNKATNSPLSSERGSQSYGLHPNSNPMHFRSIRLCHPPITSRDPRHCSEWPGLRSQSQYRDPWPQ